MNQVFLRQNEQLISAVFDFFTSQVNDEKLFRDIIQKCSDPSVFGSQGDSVQDIQSGFFSSFTFSYYAAANGLIPANQGVKVALVEQILGILTDLSIINRVAPYSPFNKRPLYYASTGIPKWYKESKCLFNKMFGFDYIAKKYANSVFKISIFKNGDYSIGTGFVILSNNKSFLLTNNHVIDAADQIKIFDSDDNEIDFLTPVADQDYDLAIIQFKDRLSVEYFKLHSKLSILSEILTIGYPPVAQSKYAYALFHKGEINSFIEDYWGSSMFLFSAKTNPGNSGSPIIDDYGTVVGIVTRQLEHKDGIFDGKLPYYAGIPSAIILNFLNSRRQFYFLLVPLDQIMDLASL